MTYYFDDYDWFRQALITLRQWKAKFRPRRLSLKGRMGNEMSILRGVTEEYLDTSSRYLNLYRDRRGYVRTRGFTVEPTNWKRFRTQDYQL